MMLTTMKILIMIIIVKNITIVNYRAGEKLFVCQRHLSFTAQAIAQNEEQGIGQGVQSL